MKDEEGREEKTIRVEVGLNILMANYQL